MTCPSCPERVEAASPATPPVLHDPDLPECARQGEVAQTHVVSNVIPDRRGPRQSLILAPDPYFFSQILM